MALSLIPDQPVILNPEDDCPDCDPRCFCQTYGPSDKLEWQAKQTPCDTIDPCPEPTFGAEKGKNPGPYDGNTCSDWTLPAGWSCATDGICHTPGTANVLLQDFLSATTIGNLYRIRVSIQNSSAGAVTVGFPLETPSDAISGNDTFDIYLKSTDFASTQIEITPSSNFDGCVYLCSIKEVTNFDWEYGSDWEFTGDCTFCHGATDAVTRLRTNGLGIIPGSYYQLKIQVSGDGGSFNVRMYDSPLLPNYTGTGLFTIYITAGTNITFDELSIGTGGNACFEFVEINLLKNDFMATLNDSETGAFVADISEFIEYYQDWVTISELWSAFEIAYGCYTLNIYNACCTCVNPVPCFEVGGIIDEMSPANLVAGHYYMKNNGTVVLWNGSSQEVVSCPNLFVELLVSDEPDTFQVGCYQYDFVEDRWKPADCGCNLLCNGSFDIADTDPDVCWTQSEDIGATSEISGNGLWEIITEASTTSGSSINQPVNFCECRRYHVSIDYFSEKVFRLLTFIQSAPIAPFDTFFSDTSGDLSGSGTYEFDVELSPFTTNPLYFVLWAFSQGDAVTVFIENVNLTPLPVDTSIDCAEYTSNCLCYKETVDCREKIIKAYSDNAAYGFEFANTGFRLQVRTIFALDKMSEDGDESSYIYSNGVHETITSQSEPFKTLFIEQVDDITHNTIRVMRRLRHFYLGDQNDVLTEYFVKKGDYQPEWVKDSFLKLAPSRFDVSKKGSIGFMNNCD